ncbi:MAG: hypothetical protein WD063_04835 [Pirellulales bacterium]
MTDRERWTVYPLLFLTLGIALRDKLGADVADARYRNVLCNALVVADRLGKQQVVLSSNAGGGFVTTIGNSGGPDVLVGHTTQLSGLLFVDAQGNVRHPSIAVPVGFPNPEPAGTPGARPDDPVPAAEP